MVGNEFDPSGLSNSESGDSLIKDLLISRSFGFVSFVIVLVLGYSMLSYWTAEPPPSSPKLGSNFPGLLLDVNSVTAAQLEALPDIGPELANRIVSYRRQEGEFESLEELLNVRGLGATTLSRVRELLFVRRPTETSSLRFAKSDGR